MKSIPLRTLIGIGCTLTPFTLALGACLVDLLLRPLSAGEALTISAAVMLTAALGVMLRRAALEQLETMSSEQRAENLRFDTAINNISQGLCFFDGDCRLIVCNDKYATMYGLTRDKVRRGMTLREIIELRYAEGILPVMTHAAFTAWRDSIAATNKRSDTIITLSDGRVYAVHHEPMSDGGWVATHDDITEQRRAQADIERMARCDALTGLPNRLQFRERLSEALHTAGPDNPVAVLCIDLDRFKAVNDTLGHPVGDQLLRAASQRLRQVSRQPDLVARLGGDEFAIIQVGAPQPAAALALAERLVATIGEAFELTGHQVQVGASVGIALIDTTERDPDEVLKQSDLALYDAKARGRGRHSVYREAMVEQARERRTLETDLRDAELRGELELHYQPIVSLPSGRIVAFEALMRWRHPTRGMVMPGVFIPLAEETGLIEQLGAWALNEAFQEAKTWPASVGIAVNLSPVQVKNGRLQAVVGAALRASGLEPGRVELEITESVHLDEDSGNLERLRELHALGVRISLDDFGVGYSSLSYLRSFPFSKIKIDRSFVNDIVDNGEAAAIVRAISTLGSNLGMVITAEGVERPEQLHRLIELGCDEAQGYFFGRPQPASNTQTLLQAAFGRSTEPGSLLALAH
jgi:diguanylate cyclase (GGDEF)-like protein